MKKLAIFWIVLFLLVSTGFSYAIDKNNVKKDKEISFEDKNRANLHVEIHSPIEGFDYDFSEILINISAWSDYGECFAYECENYDDEECLDDPEGFDNCFIDDEGECDTYECWDITDYNDCISYEYSSYGDCIWNGDNETGSCSYNGTGPNCWNFQNESDCSIPNQYDLTCYWDDELGGCDDLECDFFSGGGDNKTICEEDSYEMGCHWESDDILEINYNPAQVNGEYGGPGFEIYYGEIYYWFEDGENWNFQACAYDESNNYGCDTSEFSVTTTEEILQCGDTITENTTLIEDLNCSGSGLIIGADDITLDCDGYSIEGPNNSNYNGDHGIYFTDIIYSTIKNCKISGFVSGINMTGGNYNNLFNNDINNNLHHGIDMVATDYNNLFNNTINYNSGSGIYLSHNDNNNIYGNTVSYNEYRGINIYYNNDNNSIYDNTVSYNENYGIYLSSNNDNNSIWNNSFIDNNLTVFGDSFNAYQNNNNNYNNNWNLSEVGNYWTDFEDNLGFPNHYNISGGDAVDWHPVGAFGIEIISPEWYSNYSTPEVFINISYFGDFDIREYTLQRRNSSEWAEENIIENENYTGPFYLNLANGEYDLAAFANNTFGTWIGVDTSFTVNATGPDIIINSPSYGTEFNDVLQILLNFSADSNFGIDTIRYNSTTGWIEYTESIYVDIENLDVNCCGYQNYMLVCANDSIGNEGCDLAMFYLYNNPPSINIDSPYNSYSYNVSDQSSREILLDISTWDNLVIDTVWYDVNNESPLIYEEPIILEFEIGNYALTACVNDSLGQVVCDVANFVVKDTNNPEIIIHSPLEGVTYETTQILVNFSASDNVEVDTIWYNHSGTMNYYEQPVYEDFNLSYSYLFFACVNDTSGNTNCENYQFNISMPDLTVTNINSFLSEAGGETTAEITFKNTGYETSEYYYAYTFDYGNRDLIRELFNGRGLEPGEESTVSVSYVYDFGGNYTFYFELDPDNLIDEFNESNNIGLETYFINGTPDLTSTLLFVEQNYENLNLFTFNIDISALEGTIWVEDFTYHIDYGDGEGEGGLISETVMPWESYNFNLTHEYSTFGNYSVFFEVDPENFIFELNESNNFFETTIILEDISEDCVKGDVNGDETINVLDVVSLVRIILGETVPNELQSCTADLNEDGTINVLDVVGIVDIVLSG